MASCVLRGTERISKGKKRCCANYRTIGLKCYPCIGSFGIECMQKCPEGFYGVQCAEVCSCTKCNKTTGDCFNKTITSSEEPHSNSESIVRSTIIGVGLLLGAVVIITLLLLYVMNRKLKIKNGLYQEEKENCNDENSPYYSSIEDHAYRE
ncbi:multiple epidermal growth factor-like domains protein 10 [Saccostrea cucullata]|uniref:multiple epidermal growth factor-like domains protein 10 n=1 Tax=Saccostrea cuccullata TaxID=36930 RepID=UPI002ED226A3